MDGVNFSRLLKFYQTTLTVVLVPRFFIALMRFCSLSLTRHNDNILGKNTPSRESQINNIYTPPNLAKGGVQKFFLLASFSAPHSLTPLFLKFCIKPCVHFACDRYPVYKPLVEKFCSSKGRYDEMSLFIEDALNALDCSSTIIRQN